MVRSICAMLISASALIMATAAQGQSPEANRFSAIAPFLDDQAIIVARVDLDRVSIDPTATWLISAGFPAKETPSEIEAAFQPLDALKRAGAREVYGIVSPAYLPATIPAVIVVPLTAQTDAAAVAEVLKKGLGAAETIRGAVCAGPKINLERLRAITPAPQPLLEQALASAGDGAVRVAVSLTADQRRAIEETLPELPAEMGGGTSKVLTRGLLWIAASVDLPPRPAVRAVAQCSDQKAAENARALIVYVLDAAGESGFVREAVPSYTQIIPTLTPKVAGDTLALLLQAANIEAFAKDWLAAAEAQKPSRSAANLHMILLACMEYAEDHNDEWPDELKQLLGGGYLHSRALLKNPMRPDLEIGYAYRKPDKDAPPGTVILYEQYEQWPAGGINVAFRDGAVMQVRDQQRFKQMLEKGR